MSEGPGFLFLLIDSSFSFPFFVSRSRKRREENVAFRRDEAKDTQECGGGSRGEHYAPSGHGVDLDDRCLLECEWTLYDYFGHERDVVRSEVL
jgi:hypothetical protein